VLATDAHAQWHAALTGRQGALTGINVEQLLRRLERRPLSGRQRIPQRAHAVRQDCRCRCGSRTAPRRSNRPRSKARRERCTGGLGLRSPPRDLDLKGIASLFAAPRDRRPAPFELPFVVQGPWDDPLMLPDPEILIRRSARPLPCSMRCATGAPGRPCGRDRALTGGKLSTTPRREATFPDDPVTEKPAE
jgi:AsmA protein